MPQLQPLILLTLRMKIDPTHTPHSLIKANIIKPLKTRPRNIAHLVVRHEEILFPPHEEAVFLEVVVEGEGSGGEFGGCGVFFEGGEAGPVLEVDFFGGVPGGSEGFEEVFGADDFAFEESC